MVFVIPTFAFCTTNNEWSIPSLVTACSYPNSRVRFIMTRTVSRKNMPTNTWLFITTLETNAINLIVYIPVISLSKFIPYRLRLIFPPQDEPSSIHSFQAVPRGSIYMGNKFCTVLFWVIIYLPLVITTHQPVGLGNGFTIGSNLNPVGYV